MYFSPYIDQHVPSFVDSIRLVLQDYEHETLHTPRSYPHWRSTHLPSFVDSIRLVLQDMSTSCCILLNHAHIEDLTHPLLRQSDSLNTTWSWARHVAYSSIVPTLEINTSLPSSIWFLVLQDYEHITLRTPLSHPQGRSWRGVRGAAVPGPQIKKAPSQYSIQNILAQVYVTISLYKVCLETWVLCNSIFGRDWIQRSEVHDWGSKMQWPSSNLGGNF
jgi:hypothetical protein